LLLFFGGGASIIGLWWPWDPIDGVLIKRVGLLAAAGGTLAYGLALAFLGPLGFVAALYNLGFAVVCLIRAWQVSVALAVYRSHLGALREAIRSPIPWTKVGRRRERIQRRHTHPVGRGHRRSGVLVAAIQGFFTRRKTKAEAEGAGATATKMITDAAAAWSRSSATTPLLRKVTQVGALRLRAQLRRLRDWKDAAEPMLAANGLVVPVTPPRGVRKRAT
jgi:hypothetical protein